MHVIVIFNININSHTDEKPNEKEKITNVIDGVVVDKQNRNQTFFSSHLS